MNSEAAQLSHWVLDEGIFVTCSYLLRNSNLDVIQAQKLFEEFLADNIANENVSATYFLVGTLKGNSDDEIMRKKSTICRAVDLDETKKLFLSVDNCTIYSVQAKPLTDFNVLFNASWLDSQLYMSPTKEKTLVCNSTSVQNYKRWKESHKEEEKRLEQSSVKSIFEGKMKEETKQKEEQKTVKQIDQLFSKSVKKAGSATPEKSKVSPKARTTPPQESSSRKVVIESDGDEDVVVEHKNPVETNEVKASNGARNSKQKRKSQNLLYSSDEEDVENTSTSSTNKSRRIASGSPKNVSSLLESNTDDIFCTGEDSSPEKWNSKTVPDPEVVEDASKPADKNTTRKSVAKNVKSKTTKTTAKNPRRSLNLIGASSESEQENNEEIGNDVMEIDDEDPLPKSLFKNAATKSAGHADKRREKVTESYIDEDGFLVTEVVTKEVDSTDKKRDDGVTPSGTNGADPSAGMDGGTSSTKVLKPSNGAPKPKKKATVPAAPAAQTKISSFFKKN